jgi:glycosyltransferase involved in cell wall biosynthesis
MKEPEVSVLMAVYNERPYLEEALRSILDQTFKDFEFIIINDGSTDGSKEVLERFADADDRIQLVHQPINQGLIYSLNRGLDLARGRYIARMDADDISHPKRLERQVDFLHANSRIGIVGSRIEWITPDGVSKKVWRLPTDPDLIAWKLLFNACLDHPTILARKSVMEELGGYAEWPVIAEDYELWTRAVREFRLANLPQVLLRHRQHEASVTIKRRDEQIRVCCRIAANFHRALLGDRVSEKLAHWLVWMETKGIDRAVEETGVRDLSMVQRYLRDLYNGYVQSLCSNELNIDVRRHALARLDTIASADNSRVSKTVLQKVKNRFMRPRKQVVPWVFVSAKEKMGLEN